MHDGTRPSRTATTKPSQAYAAGVAAGDWQDDPAQRAALPELDRVAEALQEAHGRGRRRFGRWLRRPAPAIRGLYLWGGVGRGKTFLADLLHEHAGIPQRRRLHFHRFMQEVHGRLARCAEQRDPLDTVAAGFAKDIRLLVLDEFFVADIADAMILGRLLDRLFAAGLTLVTTSNLAPSGLYSDGLQRARFLPAIALLERHCRVVELASPHDYRLRQLTAGGVYHAPLDEEAEAALASCYARLAGGRAPCAGVVAVHGRDLPARAVHGGVAWFDFAVLCEGPRAVADYIEIARDFHSVLVSGVPVLDGRSDDAARRFVHLVDELYDRRVNLIVSAAAPPAGLYKGERLRAEFGRTTSRLVEMQSTDYLGGSHRG